MMTVKRGIVVAVFVAFVIASFVSLHSILTPFIVAALIAYLLDPAADKLEAKGCNRTIAVVLIFSVFSIVVLLLLALLLPLMLSQLFDFIQQIPAYLQAIQQLINPLLERYMGVATERFDAEKLKELLQGHWKEAGGALSNILAQAGSSAFAAAAAFANIVLVPVVAFYLLRDWDVIVAKMQGFIPKRWYNQSLNIINDCNEVLSAFLRGQLLVMTGLGIIYSVGLGLVGLKLALFIGMLAGLASIVPYLGAFLGILIASIAAYVQFQDFMPVVYVMLVFMVGQGIESMLLTPLLVGDKIGLHPVAVIFAIMAGGQLAGFVGILTALPVAAVLMVLIRLLISRYLKSEFYLLQNATVEEETIAHE